jgi:hypothetical protein
MEMEGASTAGCTTGVARDDGAAEVDLCGVGAQTQGGLAAALASLEPVVLATLTDLNLSHNDLETLPPLLFHMPCLTRLVRPRHRPTRSCSCVAKCQFDFMN